MIDSETLAKLKNASIKERITLIEVILRSVKHDMQLTSSQALSSGHHPLRGKVIRYDDPYEPVAAEDWEASA